MAKVVLTGATGFIGGHVARLLLQQGHKVTLLIRRISVQAQELAQLGARLYPCDLFRPETYTEALLGTECFFHLAAQNTTDTSDRQLVLDSTLGLTKTVLTAVFKAGIPKVVYTSSVVVLGRSPSPTILLDETARVEHPESPYVEGKLLAENWVEDFAQINNWDVRRMYPSWVVGPRDPGITPPHKIIKDFVAKGQPFYFGGGVSVAAVEEVAKAHVNAWLFGKPNGQYIVSGQNITFKQLYEGIARVFGVKSPTIRFPKPLMVLAAKGAEFVLGEGSPVKAAYVKSLVNTYSWYTPVKAQQELDYQIPSLDQILESVKPDTMRRLNGTYYLNLPLGPATETKYSQPPLLITGFPGWLGNRMVELFASRYAERPNEAREVRLLVHSGQKHLPSLPPNFKVFFGDVTDPSSLAEAIRNVGAVYHLAGVIYPKDLSLFSKVNYQGTVNVAEAAIQAGTTRLIFMSTDSTVGYNRNDQLFTSATPPSPYKNYGKSKWMAEEYLNSLQSQGKLNVTSLRGFWFFGPHVPARNLGFLQMFKWPFQLVFGNGKNLRSISHLDDLIQAFEKVENNAATFGKFYWIPSLGKPKTVDEIYGMLGAAMGRKTNLIHIPNFICDILSGVDSLLTRLGILQETIHAAGKFHKTIAGSDEDARRDFGYEPKVTEAQIQAEIRQALALG